MKAKMQVLGYHGTFEEAAKAMCQNEFKFDYKNHHWLGNGIYFFQDAPYRAWEWANNNVPEVKIGYSKPAVICAVIELKPRGCIDLLDIRWFPYITKLYRDHLERLGKSTPDQISIKKLLERDGKLRGESHRLDCDIIDQTVLALEQKKITIHAVRAAFLEGVPIISDNSHLFDRAHVQIAIRDTGFSIIKKCSQIKI